MRCPGSKGSSLTGRAQSRSLNFALSLFTRYSHTAADIGAQAIVQSCSVLSRALATPFTICYGSSTVHLRSSCPHPSLLHTTRLSTLSTSALFTIVKTALPWIALLIDCQILHSFLFACLRITKPGPAGQTSLAFRTSPSTRSHSTHM